VIGEELKKLKRYIVEAERRATCDRGRHVECVPGPAAVKIRTVSGHAPAEAALDQVKVFLSFVPFQKS